MKIYKNDSDIILYPITKCSECDIKTQTGFCKWLEIVNTRNSMDCGCIRIDV